MEPELVSILRPDCLKVEGTGTTCQERNTLGPTVSGPSAWDHGLKIQVGYLTTKPGLLRPKDDGASGFKTEE